MSPLATVLDLMMARERDAFARRMSYAMYRSGWYVGQRFEATHYTTSRLRSGPNTAKQRRALQRRLAMVGRGSAAAIERAIAERYGS